MSFDFDNAHLYRASKLAWPVGYPADSRTLFAPTDGEGIHRLLVDIIDGAQHSLVGNMFGYDDDDADAALRVKAADPNVYFQLSLDSTQAAGVHEKALLAKWSNDAMGNSIAIGQSVKHAISHLKVLIVDGLFVISGSTNWSLSGEQKQDNEFTVHRNAVLAAQYRSILDINHTEMLKQMAAKAAV